MNFFLRLGGFVWSVYGMLVMGLFLPVYLLLSSVILFLFGRRTESFLLGLGYKIFARLVSWFILIRYKPQFHFSIEKIKQKSFVIVSNHKSILDVFTNQITSPVIFKFLSKSKNEKIPVMGNLIKKLCISINLSDAVAKEESFEVMGKHLKDGMSILIFPEGTRNRTEEPLKSFYDGAFKLAIDNQVPVLVNTILDADKLTNPSKSWELKPGKIHCHWDGPISTSGLSLNDLEKLKLNVQSIMLNRLKDRK